MKIKLFSFVLALQAAWMLGTGNPRGKLTVQAAVPASGKAIIKQVFVDGKPYAEAMKQTE